MKKKWNYKLIYNKGVIIKEPSKEVQQYIKLFTDNFLMEFLPKEIILLNKKDKTPHIKFKSRKYPKPLSEMEYVPDMVHRQLKEIGFPIPFWWIKKFGFNNPQKKRDNKHLLLDLKR